MYPRLTGASGSAVGGQGASPSVAQRDCRNSWRIRCPYGFEPHDVHGMMKPGAAKLLRRDSSYPRLKYQARRGSIVATASVIDRSTPGGRGGGRTKELTQVGRIDASQGDHLRAMQNDLAVEAREGLASGAGLNWSFETYRRRRLERYAVAEGNRLLTWTLDQLAGGLDQFDPADPDVIAVRSHIADQRAEALFSEDDPDVQSMDAQVDQAIGDWEGRARREGRAAQIAEVDRECADTFTDCVTCKAGDQP